MITTQGISNYKTLYSTSSSLKSLTAPWISHVCNRRQVSYVLLEIFMCSSDTCTMNYNSCLLYYIAKFFEIRMKIISFHEITNFTNACRLATFLALFKLA